jgi:hypothetical protein
MMPPTCKRLGGGDKSAPNQLEAVRGGLPPVKERYGKTGLGLPRGVASRLEKNSSPETFLNDPQGQWLDDGQTERGDSFFGLGTGGGADAPHTCEHDGPPERSSERLPVRFCSWLCPCPRP